MKTDVRRRAFSKLTAEDKLTAFFTLAIVERMPGGWSGWWGVGGKRLATLEDLVSS